MKDMTVSKFCIKFDACKSGRVWAYKQTLLKSKAMMSDIWPLLIARPEDLRWAATREGVFSDKDLRLMACQFVRETPLTNGRKVWDLLTDKRSRNAVIIAEKFANGEVTNAAMDAARAAAGSAAWDAAWAAAWAAAGDAAGAAAGAAAGDAARAAAWAAAGAYQAHIILSYGNPFTKGV